MPSALTVAVAALLAPLLGVQGLPRLLHRDWAAGGIRLVLGVLFVFPVVAFYGWGSGVGTLLTSPATFLVTAIVCVGGYLFLWVEGLVYAWRRLPPLPEA